MSMTSAEERAGEVRVRESKAVQGAAKRLYRNRTMIFGF